MPTQFINIDLDITSKSSLKTLNDELAKQASVSILHHDTTPNNSEYFMRLECYDGGDELTPSAVLNLFCDLINGLSKEAKDIWNSSIMKTLDIGLESFGSDETYYQQSIPHETVLRLANIGASLSITIYNRKEEQGAASNL